MSSITGLPSFATARDSRFKGPATGQISKANALSVLTRLSPLRAIQGGPVTTALARDQDDVIQHRQVARHRRCRDGGLGRQFRLRFTGRGVSPKLNEVLVPRRSSQTLSVRTGCAFDSADTQSHRLPVLQCRIK